MAKRTAWLCQAADEAYNQLPSGSSPLYYVMGTEVPPPGGAVQETAELQATTPEHAQATLQVTRQAFLRHGLDAAWERVMALVVQPGVEYGDATVHAYDRSKAQPLSRLIESYKGLVYEAHSTDYQTPQALRQMVEDHFAILKVGPALTFALRQALFALARMEAEWLGEKPGVQLSRLPDVLEQAMLADPRHWRPYYQGNEGALRFARKYSLSDRSRYYWAVPQVQQALERLFKNLEENPVPLGLLSQFLPVQHAKVRQGRLGLHPLEWLDDAVQQVLREYHQACGWEAKS
jgi:D-tagatose-1,6-bisphosphate aldolase subunit GatZ/KbaZ